MDPETVIVLLRLVRRTRTKIMGRINLVRSRPTSNTAKFMADEQALVGLGQELALMNKAMDELYRLGLDLGLSQADVSVAILGRGK